MRGRTTSRKRPAFGARLAAVRNERGVTQNTLARKLKVNRSLIRYYERDTRDPKVSFVIRCADALEVPVEVLIGKTGTDKHHLDPAIARFARLLMTLDAKSRGFGLRLFSRQLTELRRQGR